MLVLKTLIFTILVPGAITVVLPHALLSSDMQIDLNLPAGAWRLGVLPMGVGVCIYLWCAADFVAAGRGTPNPADPPQLLVSRGLYRWTRNPMYVGVTLIVLGEGVVFDSLTLVLYAALLWCLFHLRVISYEERQLRRKFGASYEAYCQAVPRWIPRAAPRG